CSRAATRAAARRSWCGRSTRAASAPPWSTPTWPRSADERSAERALARRRLPRRRSETKRRGRAPNAPHRLERRQRNPRESGSDQTPSMLVGMSVGLTVHERASRVVAADLEISALGPCHYPSPLAKRLAQTTIHYVGQADRVLLEDRRSDVIGRRDALEAAPSF